MSSATSAPPGVSKTSDLSRPARGVEVLSPRAFRTLLLAIAALAAMMAAEGVQSFAQMRERHYVILARQQAVSPVSYGTELAALHALAPTAAGVRVLVRSDSAAAHGAALCALASATAGDAGVRWVAFSADVDPCVAHAAGARMLRAGAPAAAEMRGARWVVLDAEGRARYSRPGVPSAAQVRRVAELLAAEAELGRIADAAPGRSGNTAYVLDVMSASISAFEPPRIAGGRVYGATEDEMHVQRVEAYRAEAGR